MQERANKNIVNTSNLEADDDIIVSSRQSTRLAQEKIKARMQLLAMPKEEAQKLVEQTLYPQYWEFDPSTHVWEESIPTHYGEDTDPY
jgi:hypothetical protein